ncbi:DUF4019 domain-containing protein [Burkholderia alba]|uniref:DUF4019 domain-containing protein n=1 Tax=Burkholderia alba TaxID=2683677 RepID=UPI002B059BAC|nr:DUF4019 domain-containing protein [Burkholderia alba]
MKHRFAQWTVASIVAAAATLAHAQSGTSADELIGDADRIVQQLDAGRFGDVWNGVSPFVKSKVTQQQFVTETQQARQSLGAVTQRGWAAVTRIQFSNSKTVPDGLYANVDYATTLSTGKIAYEKLSFRLEDDGKWRLTGYVPRQTQGPLPGAASQ